MTLPKASAEALAENGFTIADLTGKIVTMDDVARAGFCGRGLVPWLAQNGFDLRDFVKNGMTAEQMMMVGDAHGIRVVIGKLKAAS